MTWWIVCLTAIALTLFAKWYFANAVFRFRHTLNRLQRETLERKGTLQDARRTHQDVLKQIKSHEIDIARMKKRVAEQTTELRNRQKSGPSET